MVKEKPKTVLELDRIPLILSTEFQEHPLILLMFLFLCLFFLPVASSTIDPKSTREMWN